MFNIRIEGKQPIYEQICAQISGLITSGVLAAGERLPTVRETAKSLGINPNTVQKAYMQLEQQGFIYSIPAKGSYVSDNAAAADALKRKAVGALRDAMNAAKNSGIQKSEAMQLLETVWC